MIKAKCNVVTPRSTLLEAAMLATLLLSMCLSLTRAAAVPPEQDDPLRVSEEMKEYLKANIDHGVGSLQQVSMLVRLVFQQNSLHFPYVPETRTAAETFSKRGGNCVSFTFLFLAMARHLGLDARFREVDIVPIWSKVGSVISVSRHANAVVYIDGQAYVVDLFPRVSPLQTGGRIVSDERALAHFLSNRGVDHLGAGRQETAIEYFQRAMNLDPTAAFVWANMGAALSISGRLEDGEKAYLRALKLDPSELVAMSNLAALYERLGRERDAKNYQARVRKFKLRNPYYHYGLGMQSYEAGEFREAVDHFRSALKLKPVEHNFYLALARTYAKLGQMDKASSNLKLAAKNAPDQASKSRYNEKLAVLATLQARS
jgi:Flp pilus assembly protein TadD